MELFVESVAELLLGFAKHRPDKMPDDIAYKPDFSVRHPVRKTLARICASVIVIAVFSLLWIVVKNDTRYLFVIFIVSGVVLLILSLISFSFSCSVTEEHLKRSYWGSCKKCIEWNEVRCVKVVEQTDEKSVIIAVYNHDGQCIIDLNTDMENAWYVVKMAEHKNIPVEQEKDLPLKTISHL